MRLALLAAAALCVSSLAAHADTYQIAVTSGTDNLVFDVPSSPTNPQQTGTGGFELNNLMFTFDGSRSTGDIAFYPASSQFEGFEAQFGSSFQYFVAVEGIQVFTGTTQAPTFTLGQFTSTDVYGLAGSTATVNITDIAVTPPPTSPTSVTPEPSSIALLGTGMLGIAGVVRKRFAA